MAKIVLEEQPEFVVLPDDSILFLKIEDVNTREITSTRNDSSWTKLEFKFKILGIQVTGDGSPLDRYDSMIGQEIWGSVPFRLTDSPENKLRIWSEAILDMDLGVGFELDTDYFKGRECRGITSTYEKKSGNPDPKTGKMPRRHQIETLLRKGGVSAPQPGGGWAQPQQSPQPQPQLAAVQDPWAGAAQVGQQQQWGDPPF